MEVRKWTTVDVHFWDGEEKMALKERKRLIAMGYELSCEDEGGEPNHHVDQYIKFGRSRKINAVR